METERFKYLNGWELVLNYTKQLNGRYTVTSTVYGADGYYRADCSATQHDLTMDDIDWLTDRHCQGRQ